MIASRKSGCPIPPAACRPNRYRVLEFVFDKLSQHFRWQVVWADGSGASPGRRCASAPFGSEISRLRKATAWPATCSNQGPSVVSILLRTIGHFDPIRAFARSMLRLRRTRPSSFKMRLHPSSRSPSISASPDKAWSSVSQSWT
ncbi:MAG: hypothetical protein MZV64_12440 [Ignavibacteriales bacterium]|nr:hypothetical protein [Ignavibacteriales bacterium]